MRHQRRTGAHSGLDDERGSETRGLVGAHAPSISVGAGDVVNGELAPLLPRFIVVPAGSVGGRRMGVLPVDLHQAVAGEHAQGGDGHQHAEHADPIIAAVPLESEDRHEDAHRASGPASGHEPTIENRIVRGQEWPDAHDKLAEAEQQRRVANEVLPPLRARRRRVPRAPGDARRQHFGSKEAPRIGHIGGRKLDGRVIAVEEGEAEQPLAV
mmetsp:Transcript_8936/g.18940  ORF Transcript_8936/g.18940 Transcript_8936/m.18940 type:complete len:212 (+) Transcript_8936:220-855(+)